MKKSIGKAISSVMIITLMCRLMALISNQFYISYFGASDTQLNIYSYAVSVPNIIFNSLGTAISTVVIPIFASLLAEKKRDEANRFVSNIITIFGSIILLLIAIGMCLAPFLPKLTDFKTGESYAFAVKALMIVMPVMLFYGISYIFQGVLQSLGSFAVVAAVSLPSSIIIITYVLTLADRYGVTGLLWATVLGLFMQAAILIPPALKKGFRFSMRCELTNPHVKRAFSLIIPVLIGSGAFQINMLYNVTLTANFENSVTLLTFIQNLVLNTVLAVVYSVTAVLYPKMTTELAKGDKESYKKTLTDGINSFVFLFLPASVGMILVRKPLLNLISGYGKVTNGDIETGGVILALYSAAFISIALKELLDRAFFAAQSTKIPAVCGFITVSANVIFSQIAIRFIGVYGIPLSYTLSSFSAVAFLFVKMRKNIGSYGKETIKNLAVTALSSLIMAFAVYGVTAIMPSPGGITGRIVKLGVPVLSGAAVYGLCSVLLKNPVALKVLKRNKAG